MGRTHGFAGGQDFRLSDGRSLRPGLSEDANPRGGVGRAAVSPDASVGQLSGNAIADHLSKQPGITVRSMKLDDAEQGLSAEVLDFAEVLVWWGHVRQKEIKPEVARKIVERIERGQLSLVALHSAHWSTPFMEAMNQRTRLDAAKRFPRHQPEGGV